MNEIEQALYCMKESTEIVVCEACINFDNCNHTKQKEMAQLAVEALEKQIPEAIIFDNNDKNMCPICKTNVCTDDKYCRNCGQKIFIDWRA